MTGEYEGNHMSEISVGHPDTEEGFFPLLVPGMSKAAVDNIAAGGEATKEDFKLARDWYEKRKGQGLSPFWEDGDISPPPRQGVPYRPDMKKDKVYPSYWKDNTVTKPLRALDVIKLQHELNKPKGKIEL
jgi:hypothetical protein